jgi:integrase/recombinase XerD
MPLNSDNERIKRQYFSYLREAKHLAEKTLDGVARGVALFETFTKGQDFRRFHIQQAIDFKASLTTQISRQGTTGLSVASRHAILLVLKNFFQWLARQRSYKRIGYADAEYFSLSAKETRIATTRRDQPVPTIEQIQYVIHSMPIKTDIERRNQALVAFVLLTGARVGAVASLRIKHVDLIEGKVVQDAREVNTKASKTFTTYFFPVGADVRAIVEAWVTDLRTQKLMGHDDPLFPATRTGVGKNQQLERQGLTRMPWSDGEPIRRIFQDAFRGAGLPYFSPHSFRKTLVMLGEQLCSTPEQFKSWSQNLGHEEVLTTFYSYGEVSSRRQASIMRDLGRNAETRARTD